MELAMNAPRNERPANGLASDRLGTAAVLLAITVSLCGACVVIIESSSDAPPAKHVAARVE
jgi:nitrate/nitrite transporter NarK